MTRSKPLLVLLVVAVLATLLSSSASAQSDPRAARDAARAKKAKLAAELNTLRASERQLLSAAKVLDDQVLSQAARVDAARQAVAVANAELAEADASLKETKGSVDRLSEALVERAVATYMSPRGTGLAGVGDTGNPAAAARRRALLDSVAATDDDVIDQLQAAEQDYAVQIEAAKSARARAQARKAENESRLAALERDRASQQRLARAVSAHQKEVLAEIDAQSKSESALSRIIAERASQAARPAPATSSGGSGGSGSSATGSSSRNAGGCIWPARGRVSSEFGRRWGRLHAGIDVSAPIGTPIYAARNGTVIFAGRQSGYGNVVIVDHGGGLTTLYGHQSRLGSRVGQSVSQGQVIGYVGNTGHSTGPHVHFETRYSGSPRNPRGCLG